MYFEVSHVLVFGKKNIAFVKNSQPCIIATRIYVILFYIVVLMFDLFFIFFIDRSFLVANAQQAGCNIIYCSDGFCHMTGYSRAEVMQCPAICDFLQGPLTSQHAVSVVKEALAAGMEKHFEILYYRKDGKWL